MSLTLRQGPLSSHPASTRYQIHGPQHRLFIESSPKRVRVELGKHFVADSVNAKLLHESGEVPVYYLPRSDVKWDLVLESPHTTCCPWKGGASYFDVHAGGKVAEKAMLAYREPTPAMALLADHVMFVLDRMDALYEEDEKLVGYPHDPYHRVDVLRSSRRVRVWIDGELVAETTRPRAVFETGLPVRWYIPADDVEIDRLEPAEKKTVCPYKGHAMYRALRGRPGEVAFTFYRPLPEGSGLSGHLCFEGRGVVVEVGDHTR